MRKTKIVCTIGPASDATKVLEALIEAGMNVARLNFSHGSHRHHSEVIERLRSVSNKKGQPVAILQDLAGPKVRVGKFKEDRVFLKSGKTFVLRSEKVAGDDKQVSVSHPELLKEVQENDPILVADGAIELRVRKVEPDAITCKVMVGGELSSNKGINLPGRSLSITAMTKKDERDLEFGLEHGVDLVAMSFVRRRADIVAAREIMEKKGKATPIIAKIEKHEALENIDEILDSVDGIMVARGDLAVETALEKVPLVQKMLIRKGFETSKPVITATQMLKSMVESPRPTRAEANDVANAVLDGTDAVMLSEETAVGKYPVEAVKTMARIIEVTEASELGQQHATWADVESSTIARAVSHGAYHMAKDLKAAAILTPTQSGSTARMVSSFRPKQPIIALSPTEEVVRQLTLVWGVHPVQANDYANSEDMIDQAKQEALNSGLVQKGDRVVITAGMPIGVTGSTNLIKAEVLK